MTIQELAAYIRANKRCIGMHGFPLTDQSTVLEYTRDRMQGYVHITDEHIFECCAKASSYEDHIAMCLPIAKVDTEVWKREWNKPPPKGRRRKRFRA